MNPSPNSEQAPGNSPVILRLKNLSFHHPERELFTQLSADIPAGVTLVRGGDGRGKTTLLRLVAGALAAHGGALQIHGVSLQDQALAYRRQVFWVDPRSEAFEQLTPAEYFASQRGSYPGLDKQLLDELVDGLALAPEMHKKLYMLSTGSKRKVWLAAAFASGAAVTLLDTPFAALDKASAGFVLALLEDAASHPDRAWLVADYAAPAGVPLAGVIDLGD